MITAFYGIVDFMWGVLIAGLPVAVGGLRLKKAGESFILVVMKMTGEGKGRLPVVNSRPGKGGVV